MKSVAVLKITVDDSGIELTIGIIKNGNLIEFQDCDYKDVEENISALYAVDYIRKHIPEKIRDKK